MIDRFGGHNTSLEVQTMSVPVCCLGCVNLLISYIFKDTMQMKLLRFLLFLFAIPAISGRLNVPNPRKWSIGKITMREILESCDENDSSSGPIVILGDFDVIIEKSPVVRMNSFSTVTKGNEKYQVSHVRASQIIIVEDSLEKLLSDLTSLKTTEWWHQMIPIFIVGGNLMTCEHSKDILIETWQMDIINSIYICAESEKESALYTMNAMANYAPSPWKRVEDLDVNVFRQVFNPRISCQTLKYDKTKFLDEYQVRAMRVAGNKESNKDSAEDSNTLSITMFRAISNALNTSFVIDNEADDDAILERLSSGSSDLMLHRYPFEWNPDRSFVTPYYLTPYIAVIKLSPEESTLQKILRLWSTPVLIGAGIVLAIFSLILIIINRNISSALLDIVRLLTYVSIRTDSRSHSFRILFTTVLILMIISNGVFQGKIASFLTKQERLKAVETIDELRGLGYKFHTFPGIYEFIKKKCPNCTVVKDEYLSDICVAHLQNTTRRVCIVTKDFYHEKFALLPVEYIKESLIKTYSYYKCRDHWPIRKRVDNMLLRINGAGLLHFWRREKTEYPMKKRQADDIALTQPHYRPVKLVKLDFAFHLLVIGLLLAIAVFFIESTAADYRAN